MAFAGDFEAPLQGEGSDVGAADILRNDGIPRDEHGYRTGLDGQGIRFGTPHWIPPARATRVLPLTVQQMQWIDSHQPNQCYPREREAYRMYLSPADVDGLMIWRWMGELEDWFTVPGGRKNRWHNPFCKMRLDLFGRPLNEDPVSLLPDRPIPPVQYMPYYHICLDRFNQPHVLDPLSRVADRWFQIPFEGSDRVIVRDAGRVHGGFH